jgi:hypothetical protein
VSEADPTAVLLLLRAALDALAPLGDDAPDPDRLRATLQALDPTLSGDAFAPLAWAPAGLPAPSALACVRARRDDLLVQDEPDVPDEAIVRATQVDAELAQRLIAERTFRRFLRRHPVFPGEAGVVRVDGEPWWTWDHVLADGRWGRIRVRGARERLPQPGDAWFTLSLDDLDAEVGYDVVHRCVLGPAWRDADGRLAGLEAVREASGEPPVRRLAVDRMRAEDVPAGWRVVPFPLPDDA